MYWITGPDTSLATGGGRFSNHRDGWGEESGQIGGSTDGFLEDLQTTHQLGSLGKLTSAPLPAAVHPPLRWVKEALSFMLAIFLEYVFNKSFNYVLKNK